MNNMIRDRGRPCLSLCDHNHCFRYNDAKIDIYDEINKFLPATYHPFSSVLDVDALCRGGFVEP